MWKLIQPDLETKLGWSALRLAAGLLLLSKEQLFGHLFWSRKTYPEPDHKILLEQLNLALPGATVYQFPPIAFTPQLSPLEAIGTRKSIWSDCWRSTFDCWPLVLPIDGETLDALVGQ